MTDNEPPKILEGIVDRLWLPSGWQDLHLAIGLSGGADSVALLRAVLELKNQQGGSGRLFALHIDHQLRGEDSTEDARWCGKLCSRLGIPFEMQRCETAKLASEAGDGIEAAARQARYELLTTAAETLGARYLATAHTRDDLVETILFRIVRGTGLRGLVGIPQMRSLTPSLTLVRPLLDCSRANILSYLAELGQDFRTDESNQDLKFARNRLRHKLLPLLREEYNDGVDEALLRLASQAGKTQQVVEQLASELLALARTSELTTPNYLLLDCQAFTDQPRLVIAEALRLAWRECGLSEQAMTRDWWNKLAHLAQAKTDGEVLNLPGDVRASIASRRLSLSW